MVRTDQVMNCISCIFQSDSRNHAFFFPAWDWLRFPHGECGVKRFPRGMITRVCFCSSERETQYPAMICNNLKRHTCVLCPLSSVCRSFSWGWLWRCWLTSSTSGSFTRATTWPSARGLMCSASVSVWPSSTCSSSPCPASLSTKCTASVEEITTSTSVSQAQLTGFFNFSEEIPDYVNVNGHFLDNWELKGTEENSKFCTNLLIK